jgi:hypothetical protein
MNTKLLYSVLGGVVGVLLTTTFVLAGNLDPDDPPGSTSSYTLQDIYNRLDSGATGVQSTFTEPSAGPGSGTMHTLNEIMAKAPEIDDTDGASSSQVLTDETFWGLTAGQWGARTGSMADNGAVTLVPTTTNQTIAQGYHNGSGYVQGDTDLKAGNIRSGVVLFGLTGKCYRLQATGQTTSYASGDDGALQLGCLPAVAPCSGADGCGFNRKSLLWANAAGTGFIDKGDGTVLDVLTGLIWVKNAHCFSSNGWAAALSDVNDLNSGECGLSDGSSEGDWRLPNENELRSLIDPDQSDPALPSGHPFINIQTVVYYSSSSYNASNMWGARMDQGYVAYWAKSDYFSYNVWPVRGGQ